MISDALNTVIWVLAAVALITLASWWAHRTYRAFLVTARGPASIARPIVAPKTSLDALLDPVQGEHSGQNGLLLLLADADAFAARVLSAAQSGRSLDLMYYIWRTDLVGWLLIDAVVAAADRGVRIRLLLDDVNVQGFDRTFLLLTQHPLIEVRLFNPVRHRGLFLRRMAEMILGLARFNRRMHGKLWIADGRLAIIGGRNIGDTYFGADEGNARSIDSDVMLVGPKVAEVSGLFDTYWNLGLSLPITALWPALKVNKPGFRRKLVRHAGSFPSCQFLAQSLQGRDAGRFLTGNLRWTDTVQLLADPADKAMGMHTAPWISSAVSARLGAAKSDIRLITPYFVPGNDGLTELTHLVAQGIDVTLLTNALSSTDKVLVFGAYSQYRRPLLIAGARIFEFARPTLPKQQPDVLHSKVFILDRHTVIIGSFNYDLRSAYTNTELGLVFEEPNLVAEMLTQFDGFCAPEQAYQVMSQHDALRWAVTRAGRSQIISADPEASWHRRAISWIVGRLPIKRYL